MFGLKQEDGSTLRLESGNILLLEHEYVSSGGSTVSGAADRLLLLVPMISGGVHLAGISFEDAVFQITSIAGIVASGHPEFGVTIDLTPSAMNSAEAGGEASVEFVFEETMAEGVALNGNAISQCILTNVGAGNCVSSGLADVSLVQISSTTGGCVSSGECFVSVQISEGESEGGVVAIGKATIEYRQFNETRVVRLRFKIGDEVYVSIPYGSQFKVRRIQGHRSMNEMQWWKIFGQWVPDDQVLSLDGFAAHQSLRLRRGVRRWPLRR